MRHFLSRQFGFWRDGKCVNGNAKLLEDLTGADNSTQTGLDIEISRTERKISPTCPRLIKYLGVNSDLNFAMVGLGL